MRLTTRALRRGWLLVAVAVLAAAPAAITATPASAAPRGGELPYVGGLLLSPTRVPATVRGGALAALPASVDLRRYAPPARSQGQVGSCVAWSIGYSIMGYYANRTGGSGAPYAPLFLYLRNVAKGGAPHTGLYPDFVLADARANGIDTQADYWQGTTRWNIAPTRAQIENAKKYRISGYRMLFNGANQGVAAQASIKEALAAGAPVTLGVPIYQDFTRLRSHSLYTSTRGGIRGYHQMAVFGYDAQGIHVRNSWGQDWGNRGDVKLSWAFVNEQAISAHAVYGITTPATPADPSAPVVPAPTVTALSVTDGTAGTLLSISGSGLERTTAVRFGDWAAGFTKWETPDGLKLYVRVPPQNAPGTVDVQVTGDAGNSAVSSATKFTYLPPVPAVTGLSPGSALVFGGATVRLSGTDLTGVTTVRIGTTIVAAKSVTPTSLTFVAPAMPVGSYEVAVNDKYGLSTRAGQFTYRNPPAPTVTALTPRTGPTNKATPVVVTGKDLTGATVTVDGRRVRFTKISATQLRLTLAPHAAGAVAVRITTPGGTSAEATFTYVAPRAQLIRGR
ncbi:IPT/TIG domain-containing protein [Couchioplanes caeruleus]|uniref:IPT/TIG domain-containing protein n=2 Tax=Couchioplanes caeruleus TaxID=56438 RepID=A0A1K0G0N6_9ACTN|nr:IPT/TIG domain-containing protein [Couchioplanes caeruleus]OJF10866.1 hypothetical protein BG844_29760 [Couchioplanes caeruleus subsp. caeruleus]ROP32796.1 IPT/TIG domain-containing protein [Couchioplanes caeruleus]